MKNKLKLLVFAMITLVNLSYGQEKREYLKIKWPVEYKWKQASNQDNASTQMIEIVPGDETLEKWTIIGTMLLIKGAVNVPMEKAMNLTYGQAKQVAEAVKLTMIEKDEKAKHPWILFKMETPYFKDDVNPESELYYIVQGEKSLYTNFVAIKEKKLSDEFVAKWSKIFKSSEIVVR